jgi:pimeloyl-ACP methyl ester carboxylesterase
MTVSSPATTAFRERAVQFGRTGELFGIWCEPTTPSSALPVVILGAGILHRIGPSRVSVHLARALASRGHPVLRFDLSGIGDSGRAPEPNLEDAVQADIRDAVTLATARSAGTVWAEQVALVGFCAGADNALYVGATDPRIRAAVLFDPTVHRTAGFHRRKLMQRLSSAETWSNVLSGRSLLLRIEDVLATNDAQAKPPGYYGLLVASAEETDRRARAFCDHGGQLRYVISRAAQRYCNAPEQVSEALPTAFSPAQVHVVWAEELDHVFSTRAQVRWFVDDTSSWLASLPPL